MAKDELTQKWLKRISQARNDASSWIGRGEDNLSVYRNEDNAASARDQTTDSGTQNILTQSYNSLYSNTEIIRPALFARSPTPDVRRRYQEESPDGDTAAGIMQDALSFFIDDDYKFEMDQSVKDYILTGRGNMRVRFIPTMEKRETSLPKRTTPASNGDSHVHIMEPDAPRTKETLHARDHTHDVIGGQIMPATTPGTDEPHTHEFEDMARTIAALQAGDLDSLNIEIDENGTPFIEDVVFEEVLFEHVTWKELVIPKVKKWRDVSWIAFIHDMNAEDLEERFDKDVVDNLNMQDSDDGLDITIEVFEVWDKKSRTVLHVTEASDEPLETPAPDPLGLEQFFPIPKPLNSNPTSGTLYPVADYTQYKALARQVDDTTRKIDILEKAIKVRGAYNGRYEELGKVIEGDTTEMVPVDSWAATQDTGGMAAHVWLWPIEQVVLALNAVYQSRAETLKAISDLSGVSDIMRGVTDPNEAAQTNLIKGQFSTLRLKDRQEEVMRFNREVIRLGAELISNNFQATTLSRITGKDVTPQVMALLRDDAIRNFNIDVETDSTIAIDEAAEQKSVTNMMTGLVGMVEGFGPAVASGQIPADAVLSLVRVALRPFKGSREVQAILSSFEGQDVAAQAAQEQVKQRDETIQALQEQMQGLLQDKELDKAALAIAAKSEDARAANATELRRLDQQELDNDMAIDVAKLEQKARGDDADRRIDVAKLEQKARSEHADRLVDLETADAKLELDADKVAFASSHNTGHNTGHLRPVS